jgi:DHA1 family bicyclomycin/chloramphenicol resistance-like MFS transporter
VCATAPTIEVIVTARLVQGLAGAAGIVIARAVVRDVYSGVDAARFFSLLMLVHGAAPILAPIIGGQLLIVVSWRGVFVLLTAIGFALLLVVAGTLRETLPPDQRRSGGVRAALHAFRTLLSDPGFLGYAVSCGLAFGAMFAYIGGGPFVLQELYGMSPQAFSLLFAGNAAGFVLSGQINGRLVGRVPPQRLLAIGLVVGAAGATILLAVTLAGAGLVAVASALFLVVAPLGFVLPNAAALALAGHPSTAGSASALLGAMQFLVGAVVAPVAGLGGADSDVTMAVLIAALATAAPLSLALLTRAGRRG